MPLDRLELAWAAGFFDGEGSTVARTFKRRPGYRQLAISVPQTGSQGVPEALVRFQFALAGMGTIAGPNSDGMFQWRVFGREQVRTTLELLWPYLGDVKREQALAATALVDSQYTDGAYRRRAARTTAPVTTLGPQPPADEVVCAWSAGFLDAEGCFGLNHVGPRVNGPDWYRIRCSASQHGSIGLEPQVLVRLRDTLGGQVERHGEEDDYKWLVQGADRIKSVLERVGPWLGAEKRRDADVALATFLGQVRLKGDGTRCLRGHIYTRSAMKSGRLRKICDECERFYDSREIARQRVAFHRFEEAAQRYTA